MRRRDSLLIEGCISIGAIPLIFAVANAADVQVSSTQFRLIPQTLNGLRFRAMPSIQIQLTGQQRRLRGLATGGCPPQSIHRPLSVHGCVCRGKSITSPESSRSAVRSDAGYDFELMPIRYSI